MAKTKISHGRNRSLETLQEFGDALGDTLKNEVGKKTIDNLFSQLLGIDIGSSPEANKKSPDKPLTVKDPFTGEISVFQAADHKGKREVKKNHAEKTPKAEKRIDAAIDHAGDMRNLSERFSHMENREINQRLQEIMVELKRLVSTSKVLQMEFANVDVEQAPTQAGEYHINFFDWLLLTIRAARQKVEDSGAWLATAKGKSGKKGGYWGMFKKHGTSFGLSNERTVATQTG